MKKIFALMATVLFVLLAASQLPAFTPFYEGFENYNVAQLDFQGPWWPLYPNGNFPADLRVISGLDHGVTPHGGSKMVRATNYGVIDQDANGINLAYRVGDGAMLTGSFVVDWWFYDQLGPGGTACVDCLGIDQVTGVPNNADPTNTSSSAYAWVQRMTVGMAGNQTTGFDATKYQARIIGNTTTDGAYNAQGWFNLPSATRSIGWHEGKIIVSAPAADGTNTLAVYIDNMVTPAIVKNSKTKGGFNVLELSCAYGTSTAYFDDISVTQLLPLSGLISDAKALADGTNVALPSKILTVAPGGGLAGDSDVVYVEESGRTGAIRVHAPGVAALKLGEGDVVGVVGTIASANGEKYIDNAFLTRVNGVKPLDAVGMSNKAACDKAALGMFVKIWGAVQSVGSDNFVISDGSAVPVTVKCGATMTKPNTGDVVRVRGVIDNDGTGPVLYMNNEQVDWTMGAADYQPLPFPGAYKYARDFLVVGPFADSTLTTDAARLGHDFIADATGGQADETTLWQSAYRPAPGVALGDKVWKRSSGVGDNVSFITEYPTNNTNSVFYAHIWLYSPTDQILGMRIGSDDCSRVYVDGQQCYETPDTTKGRSESQGQDSIGFLPLHTGFNSILMKVENGTGGCGVDIQFVDSSNQGTAGYGGAVGWPGLGYLLANPIAL